MKALDWKRMSPTKRRSVFAIEGRGIIARRMRQIEQEITGAFERDVTDADRSFLRTAVRLQILLEIFDVEFETQAPTEQEWKVYLQTNQALDRSLRRLGFRPTTVPVKNMPALRDV